MKKVIVNLLIFAALALAGCKGSGKAAKITILLLGNKPTNGRIEAVLGEVNKITRERIGAELAVRYIEWADWQNQYQLALASQDPGIDLVITATDWLFAWEISRKGGFYPLTPELLQTNAPKTWAAIPPAHWDLCTENGQIWFIPEDQYTQYTNHGMYWRLDWAREGGLEDIEKYEDLEKYWDIVKRNHPDAYPWDASGDAGTGLIDGYLVSRNPVQTILGCSTGNAAIFQYHTDDPYTVVSYYMDGNGLVEAARIIDRWAKKGFWREDVLNYKGETRNLMYAGLSGSDAHHTQTYYTQTRPGMDREQPGSELQFYWWGKEIKNLNKDLMTHGAMAVNGASKNVEKALQMYDLLRKDKQIYLLYNYGIEGIDYLINEKGQLDRPAGWDAAKDSLSSNFWGGRMDEFEPPNARFWEGYQDLLEYFNSFAREYPLGKFAFDNSNVAAEMSALGNVCATYLPAIAFGKTGNPDKAVADFRTALTQAGYDKVKAEIQAQLDVLKAKTKS
jgi:hypothetical protein